MLYNPTPYHHLVGDVFPASYLESVPQSVSHFLSSVFRFILVEKVQDGEISNTLFVQGSVTRLLNYICEHNISFLKSSAFFNLGVGTVGFIFFEVAYLILAVSV